MLLGFFLFFCLIVAGMGLGGWRYYTVATRPIDDMPIHGTVRVHAKAGVNYQPKGKTDTNSPSDACADNAPDVHDVCFQLGEGYRIWTVPEAGYGPVASIVLPDDTHVDLWAHPQGVDLTLDSYRVTRWNNQSQEVVFQQEAGYARYDVRDGQPYSNVSYSVVITNGVRVLLTPGGSYSINVPRADPKQVPALTDSGRPMLLEVATRSGSAIVQSGNQQILIEPGKKVQADAAGVVGKPVAATWELIDDGNFARYPKEKYDESTDAWVIVRAPLVQPMTEPPGTFTAIQECHPLKVDQCDPSEQVFVGQFRRGENLSKPYLIGISQSLDADVSEYTQSLRFSAWTRVLTQSVESAGIDGTECPIMITLTYKVTSPTDEQKNRRICVYTGSETKLQGSGVQQYIHLKQFDWQRIEIEFRGDRSPLKNVRYLQQILIEARGHNYLSEITGISLIGTD